MRCQRTATPASGGGGGDAKTLFVENCGNCHTLAAASATGTVGPKLDGLGFGTDQIRESIVKPGAKMPNLGLSEDEIRIATAYLQTLN